MSEHGIGTEGTGTGTGTGTDGMTGRDLEPGIWTHRPAGAGDDAGDRTEAVGTADLAGGFDFAVKANIEVRGMPANAASPVFGGHLADADALVVTALKRRGGRVAGLTNMHELAFGITSNNAAFGPVRNPFDPLRSAGGSSGGSAAAVAAGLVPVSLGTDTGGSISVPAASCGVVGFRPSTGRWPNDGTIGLSWSRDTVGVHTRSVAHAALVDAWVTHEPEAAREGELPVLGVPTAFRRDLDPAVRLRFEAVLEGLGAHADIVDIDLDPVFALTDAAQWDLVGWEAPRLLAAYLAAAEDIAPGEALAQLPARAASPDVRAILQGYVEHPVTADAYAAARGLTDIARERYAAAMADAGIAALLFPTMPTVPQLLGQDDTVEHLGRSVPLFPLVTRHTGPGTVLGVPSVTLPAGLTAGGLPVGITLQGTAHRDRELLSLAARLEALLD
ncbi:amidase family protein [Paeniglutamicibacter sp. R2-26]|uniref:amidase family protein n=1 Tax=Paeniglutamicibacter sp. R2-26 TaxID=3144417 RepID=UPI003EE6D657